MNSKFKTVALSNQETSAVVGGTIEIKILLNLIQNILGGLFGGGTSSAAPAPAPKQPQVKPLLPQGHTSGGCNCCCSNGLGYPQAAIRYQAVKSQTAQTQVKSTQAVRKQ